MNSLKEIDVKNRTYYFFGDGINIKNLDQNKIHTKIHTKVIQKYLFSCIS